MAKALVRKARAAGPIDRDEVESPAYALDIQLDERAGTLRIYDPRAFHAGRRAFCRRLVEAVASQPGFLEAEIDLVSASCRLAFDPRSATARTMAEAASAAIRRAAAPPAGGRLSGWWRRPSRWSTLTAFRSSDVVSTWETLEAEPGRIRLRHDEAAGDRRRLARLAESLLALDGVIACHPSAWSRTLTIDYRPGSPIARQLPAALERALRDPGLAGPSGPVGAGDPSLPTGSRRLRYLALAGGSFAMTVVGLIVPGIPTVPFLLATSYYLARSSPRLNDRLRRNALFGPVLVDWERYHGLSRSSKARLMGLTAVIIAATAVASAGSPPVLIVLLVFAALGLYGIARLPGLPNEAPTPRSLERAPRLALPSP